MVKTSLDHPLVPLADTTDPRARTGPFHVPELLAEGKTHKEALRCLKRRISNAIFAPSRPTPSEPPQRPELRARKGNQGYERMVRGRISLCGGAHPVPWMALAQTVRSMARVSTGR